MSGRYPEDQAQNQEKPAHGGTLAKAEPGCKRADKSLLAGQP